VIKILIVEDDADIRDLTAYVLRRERFVVIEAQDGAEALRRWSSERPDLVVLDLGLPGIDGFDVLRQIRAQDKTPVLVLTGRTDNRDVVRTFSLGTDDFLAKPFEFRELTARIRAILRRAKGASYDETEPAVELEGLHLDPESCEVTWREEAVRLTRTEFRILYLLVTHAGRAVSASRLYTYVWGSEGADANALRTHISHIRRKLERSSSAPGTITSIPAVGYVFRAASGESVASSPASVASEASAAPS
jgi:two-component system KDP operon response regulator KdpE